MILLYKQGYIIFWIGIVVVVISGISYLATGEKVQDWFWKMLDIFLIVSNFTKRKKDYVKGIRSILQQIL